MNLFSPALSDLIVNVFRSESSIVKFLSDIEKCQKLRIKLRQCGLPVSDDIPGYEVDYYQLCSLYMHIAKLCMDSAYFSHLHSESLLGNHYFDLVLFTDGSNDLRSILDYVVDYSRASGNKKERIHKRLINKILSSGYLVNESSLLLSFIGSLDGVVFENSKAVEQAYTLSKQSHQAALIAEVAELHNVQVDELKQFHDKTVELMAIDGESVSDLFDSDKYGWKQRGQFVKDLLVDMLEVFRLSVNLKDIRHLRGYM